MLFEIDTTRKRETIDITDRVREIVRRSKLERGLCHVMVLHATAAIVVNENDDPNIGADLRSAERWPSTPAGFTTGSTTTPKRTFSRRS